MEDVAKLINGESVEVTLGFNNEYTADKPNPRNKKDIYAGLVTLGLLCYHNNEIRIPNKEINIQYKEELENPNFGEVTILIENSSTMLKATKEFDTQTMEAILDDTHQAQTSLLTYNNENSLACVVQFAYLSALEDYIVRREEPLGKGFADVVLRPKKHSDKAIIIELKKDSSCEEAIEQIKNRDYAKALLKEYNDRGGVIIVAICYEFDTNQKTKKNHTCKVELFNKEM